MKKALLLFTVAAAALSVSAQLPYKVIVPTTPESEGKIARLINYDTKEVVDSVVVKDQAARFEGKTDEGMIATISLEGMRFPVFILEPGTVSFGKNGAAFGTGVAANPKGFMQAISLSLWTGITGIDPE